MRNTGIFTTCNRVIAKRVLSSDSNELPIHKSVLALSAAGEMTFVQRLIKLADTDATTYQKEVAQ